MSAEHPIVTVLMPVYNGEKYLREAIDSILSQTFADFELLVINDGSTDRSMEIIECYRDPRIRLLQNAFDRGVIGARNTGLFHARGEYVAMMDCDDIAYPQRFAEQLEFLDKNADFGMIGAWTEMIDENSRLTGEVLKYTASPDAIPSLLLFNNYFAQSAVFIRRSALAEKHYRLYPGTEDYDLWVRIARNTRVWNLQKVLVRYRIHPGSISFVNAPNIKKYVREIIYDQLELINLTPSARELEIHWSMGNLIFLPSYEFVTEAETWLKKLSEANKEAKYFDSCHFDKVLGRTWFYVCVGSSELGNSVWKLFWQSPLSKLAGEDFVGRLYFRISTVFRLGGKKRGMFKRFAKKIMDRLGLSKYDHY